MNPKTTLTRYLYFLTALLLAGNIYLPFHYNSPYPKPLGPQFTPRIKDEHIKAINANQSQLVLIGDSTLHDGVDQNLLTKELGFETHKIAGAGYASAAWYLVMKNVVMESSPQPKYVVVMFRDTMLTLPYFRTSGRYLELLDDYASKNETLLIQLAFINQMNPIEKFLEQYFPLYGLRWDIREGLDRSLRYRVPSALLGCSEQCADDAVQSIFGREVNVRALNQMVEDSIDSFYAPAELNFENRVDKSFLPAMIQLAEKNHATLIFVRTRTLNFPTPDSVPPALANYINSLSIYLSQHDNVYFLDYSQDVRIKDTYYYDSLHFNETGREAFTPILADEIQAIINHKAESQVSP